MNIDAFPEDCWILIFEQCPLHSLVPLRLVCIRWRALIEQICRRKQSLKLFGSFRGLVDYMKHLKRYNLAIPGSDLYLSQIGTNELFFPIHHFKLEAALLLTELFPSVKSLVFFYYNWPSEVKLQMLLTQWPKLISLTLFGMPQSIESQGRIWGLINSMPILRHLHLFGMRGVSIPRRLPILYELEQFSLTDYRHGEIMHVLTQLGPVCKQLLLDSINCNVEILREILQANTHLTTNLTHLIMGHIFVPKPAQPRNQERFFQNGLLLRPDRINTNNNPKQLVEFVSSECQSLQYLDLTAMLSNSFETIKFHNLLGRFVELRNLTTLRLIIYYCDLDQITLFQFPKLLSIRSLHLELYPLSVDNFLKTIPPIFPNLEQLTIECYDQNMLAQLRLQLRITAPFPKLLRSNIYYQRDLSYYFSGFGYRARYRGYLQEHLGALVDFL